MSNITFKKSSVTNKVPLVADLAYGEIALNYADGKLFYKTSSNTIDYIASTALVNALITTPIDGQILSYESSTGKWKNISPSITGINTGDETLATIKTKLGITTLSGSNTGDQTLPTTLPASDVYAWAKAATKPTYTYAEVGAQIAGSYQAAGTYASGTGSASGTNTGDNAVNTQYSGLVTNATHSGDVTGSGALTIAASAVTYAKMQNVSATSRVLGRITAAAGVVEELTGANLATIIGITNTAANVNSVNGATGAVTLTNLGLQNFTSGSTVSGSNTGDNAVNTLYSSLVTNATHTGDVTGSTTLTLASVITAGGPTGSTSVVPVITYDAKGRLTAVTTATITPASIGAQAAGTYATGTGTASGTNTGDNATNTLYSGLVTNATHTGDVTGSAALTIANSAVTYAKMQNISATSRVLGRITAGAGSAEELTGANLATIIGITNIAANVTSVNGSTGAVTLTNLGLQNFTSGAIVSGSNTGDNAVNTLYSGLVTNATHTGDVTGATALTIAASAVTYAKMQNVSATSRVLGRITAAAGVVEELTGANLATIIGITNTAANVNSVNGNTGAVTAAQVSAAATTGYGFTPYSNANPNGYTTNVGTVTGVTATAPVASSGGTAPVISMAAATSIANGYMTSTYAAKLDGIAASATNVTNTNQLTNGAGFITSAGTSAACSGNAASASVAATLTGTSCSQNGDGWWRSTGATGWYSTTYAVGIYATEAGNVRTYNGANFISAGTVTGTNLSGTHTGSSSGTNTGDQTLPTTLPASDVYAWAKAATKPTYTYAEVGAQVAGSYPTGSGTHSGASSGTNTGDQTNISGNAATVSGLYALSATVNTDTKGASGINYFSGGTGNPYSDGALYQQSYPAAPTTWGAQIQQDYRTGRLAVRGLSSAAWTAWLNIIDSGNIGSQSVSYATTAGSAPASDVYSWAKAAAKPSYTYTEVGAHASLVSGTNIKTINGASILGSGDVVVGSPAIVVVSATTQAMTANNHYIFTNAAATTGTLPASPASGDMVWVTVTNSLATNVIARNAQTIMGLSEDMTINTGNCTVQLRFVNSSWRLV